MRGDCVRASRRCFNSFRGSQFRWKCSLTWPVRIAKKEHSGHPGTAKYATPLQQGTTTTTMCTGYTRCVAWYDSYRSRSTSLSKNGPKAIESCGQRTPCAVQTLANRAPLTTRDGSEASGASSAPLLGITSTRKRPSRSTFGLAKASRRLSPRVGSATAIKQQPPYVSSQAQQSLSEGRSLLNCDKSRVNEVYSEEQGRDCHDNTFAICPR